MEDVLAYSIMTKAKIGKNYYNGGLEMEGKIKLIKRKKINNGNSL